MYDKSDPRAALAPAATGKPKTGLIAEEQLATFYDSPPQIEDETGRTWLVRGHNFVVAYSDLKPGAVLTRSGQPDEYVVLLPDAGAQITACGETKQVAANSIAIVPPGDSQKSSPSTTPSWTARSKPFRSNSGLSSTVTTKGFWKRLSAKLVLPARESA